MRHKREGEGWASLVDFLFLPLDEVGMGVSHGEAVFNRERIGNLGDAEP